MSAFSTNNSDTTTLAVPKLRNDGSNWADYEPCIQRALGSKGLWRHVEGTAIVPKPYALVTGVPILTDGTTQATEDQIEAREMKIIDYNKREYLAQHVILSTTSTCLGNKIKNLKTSHDMWDAVKVDATTKSTLFLLDTEDQLASMRLAENDDPKAHLTEVKQALPTHGTATRQPPENGLDNFRLALQHYHHVLAPGVVPTNPPDNNSCGAGKHLAWHIVIKGNEAQQPHHLHHGGSTASCNQ